MTVTFSLPKLRKHCNAVWTRRKDDERMLLSNLPTAEWVPAPAYLLAYCSEIGLMPSEEHSFDQRIARVCAQLDGEGKSVKITKEGCWQLDPDSGDIIYMANWLGRNSYNVVDLFRHSWPLINEIQIKTSKRYQRRKTKIKTKPRAKPQEVKDAA